MKLRCNIVIDFENEKKTDTILKSIEVDNLSFVKARKNEKKLEACINSRTLSSLIHTLDDFLACISVAEKVVDKD